MTDPAIRRTRPSSVHTPPPASNELLARANQNTENLTSEEATQLLTAMRNNPLADTGLVRDLEARVSRDVQASASGVPTVRSGRRNTRGSRAVSQAWTESRGSTNRTESFLSHLRQGLGGVTRSARQLARISGPELKAALESAGATRQEIAEATRFVENAVAHQFEREVQGHVIERFEGLVRELDAASSGSGPEFEARIAQLNSPGGQRMLRVMRGMGIDVSELSSLVNEWGGANVDRPAVEARMREPLQQALSQMHDVAVEQLDDAQGTVFRDEAFAEYPGAADSVAREWGIPRGSFRGSTNGRSVVHDALQRRHSEATDNGLAEAAQGLPGGALFKIAVMVIQYDQAVNAATREATMAEVGEGDPGAAIVGRAEAIADLAQGAREVVSGQLLGSALTPVGDQLTEGAHRAVDAATNTTRALGTSTLGRDAVVRGVQEAGSRVIDGAQNAVRDAYTGFLRDTPVPRKATNL